MTKDDTEQILHGEILVVEDNVSDLKLISEILTKAGYRVRPAGNGELALRSAEAKLPDLFLLDINLPGMSGVDVCNRLKADPETKDIPVIFISALGNAEMKVKALEAGAVDYVTKPIEPPEVLVRIGTHLNMYRLQQNLATQAEHLKTEIEEHKRTEENLLESEEQFRLAFDQAAIGMGLASTNGKWLKVNPALCDMLGYTESELLELDFQTITHEDDLDADIKYVKQILEGTIHTYQIEKRYIRKDGEIIWINLSVSLARKSNGSPSHFISQIENITERKRAEYTLKTSEKRYRNLVSNLPGVIWQFQLNKNDNTFSFPYISDRFDEIFDISRQDVYKNPLLVFEMMGDEYCGKLRIDVAESAKALSVWQDEFSITTPKGDEKWLRGASTPEILPDGNILWNGVLIEITELKRAENELRESEERFKAIFNEAPLGVALIDSLTGYISEVNPMFAKIAGRTKKEIVTIDWMSITHPDDIQKNLDNMALLNAGKIDRFQMEKRYIHPDGTVVWINMTIAPVKVEDEYHPRHLCMVEDITERKRTEHKREELIFNIRERSKELHLLYEISKLASHSNQTWENVIQQAVNLIPTGFQYPEITCARIIIDNREFTGQNFVESEWKLSTPINISGEDAGSIEVFYTKEMSDDGDGPFLKEEYYVMNTVAKHLESIVERIRANETLKTHALELELNKKRLDILLQLTHMTDRSLEEISNFVLNEGAELTNSEFGFIGLMNEEETILSNNAWSKNTMAACGLLDKPPQFPVNGAGVWIEPLLQRKSVIINDYDSTEFNKNGVPEGHIPLKRLINVPIFEGDKIVALVAMANKEKEYNENDVLQLTLLLEGMWKIVMRKQNQESLKKYAKDLEHSNELKVLFADIMRHDLLNPAGIVQGYTEMLFDMEDDEKKINFLQKIDESNKKLINLIESTARFAKLESVEALEFGEEDIASMFKIVVENLSPKIEDKHITLEFKAEGKYPANVNPMIEEVFVNLLSNAIKYSPEKSKIIVDIIDAGENWKVAVTDFGEGVLDEHKTILFDRFQRVNKVAVKGSGLGLAIVKRIIELHGGEVGVENNPAGVGSVFWVTVGKA